MDLGTAETQVLLAVLIALITIIPTMALAIRNYFATKAQQWQVNQVPTHVQVDDKITRAIQAANAQGRLLDGTTETEQNRTNG